VGAFGVFVLTKSLWNLQLGIPPQAVTMEAVRFATLAVNAGAALMLSRFRSSDANMRSVWICSRNDAIGNVAVMLAALGVFGTGSAWPDLLVAAVMGTLALTGAWAVLRHAHGELRMSTPLPWPFLGHRMMLIPQHADGRAEPIRRCRPHVVDSPKPGNRNTDVDAPVGASVG